MLLLSRRRRPHLSSHNPICHLRSISPYEGIASLLIQFSSCLSPFKSNLGFLYSSGSLVMLLFLYFFLYDLISVSVTTVSPTVVTTTTATSSLTNVKLSPGTIIKNFFKFVYDPFVVVFLHKKKKQKHFFLPNPLRTPSSSFY